MTSTTQRFAWKDRDTAARDLLQLVHHAPKTISRKALRLLRAIRSPAIIPDLEAILLDPQRDLLERADAYDTICNTPGNFYFFDIERFVENIRIANDGDFLVTSGMLELLEHHPSNEAWIFRYLEPFDLRTQRDALLDVVCRVPTFKPQATAKRLIDLLEANIWLFDLKTAAQMHSSSDEILLQWLQDHWDEVIYVALIEDLVNKDSHHYIVPVLEHWLELKEDLFRRCPAIIEEFNQKKAELEAWKPKVESVDFQATPIWQKMSILYDYALKGEESAYRKLFRTAWNNKNVVLEQAVAVHFIGKLCDQRYPAIPALCRLLQHVSDERQYPSLRTKDFNRFDNPVRYEAGYALRKIDSPLVWEAMVDVYFMIRERTSTAYGFLTWIQDMTDRLSGIEVEPKDDAIPLEHRPWFRALVDL
ncbi:MAG: hypothetical protein K8L97_32880 [Anaerolineae bacterium]|nr:hypothetical protein [Anaerolineae bacterium]